MKDILAVFKEPESYDSLNNAIADMIKEVEQLQKIEVGGIIFGLDSNHVHRSNMSLDCPYFQARLTCYKQLKVRTLTGPEKLKVFSDSHAPSFRPSR